MRGTQCDVVGPTPCYTRTPLHPLVLDGSSRPRPFKLTLGPGLGGSAQLPSLPSRARPSYGAAEHLNRQTFLHFLSQELSEIAGSMAHSSHGWVATVNTCKAGGPLGTTGRQWCHRCTQRCSGRAGALEAFPSSFLPYIFHLMLPYVKSYLGVLPDGL